MVGISVTIITLNEEANIKRCLKSVKNFADEIILVDSYSSDNTVEVAKRLGAEVHERKFDNYANQKNYALSKTSGEWILSLDADEEISPELATEIKSQTSNLKSSVVAYSIPRKNIIFGKFIRYTRWQPELDRHIWLWKKNSGKWVGDIHEEVVVRGEVGKFKNAKIHYQYKKAREFIDMINRYSEFEANEKVKNGVKFSYIRLFYDPVYQFLVRYFYRLGFLDGWRGFVLSYLMAVYQMIVWIKVWEREKVSGKARPGYAWNQAN